MHGLGVVPPSDYVYIETNGSVIRSSTEDGLVKAVTEYREQNGHPEGKPQEDIAKQIIEQADRRVGITPPVPAFQAGITDSPKNLRERVTNWAANRFQHANREIKYVLPDEANQRAEICASCPENQDWKIGCPPCVENNDRVLVMINRGQNTKEGKKLKGCEVFGHDNNTACFLPESMLKHRVRHMEEAPDFCWMKKL